MHPSGYTPAVPAARAQEAWVGRARAVARGVRRRVLEHTLRADGGYLSQACSSAEILATLYTRLMRLGPSQAPMTPPPFPGVPAPGHELPTGALYNGPRSPELDRFFCSPAHYALVLYATLIETGRMAGEALEQFNRDGSSVEMIGAEHSPGFECTTGSLSQALSVAGGVALAGRLKGETGRVWVLLSDGEMQEGQTWEALAALRFYELENVAVYIDANGQQCDGRLDGVMTIEPLSRRLEAFGARVHEVHGHDPQALAAPARELHPGRPLVVIARTNPCQGLELLESRRPRLHYVRFHSREERRGYQEALERWA